MQKPEILNLTDNETVDAYNAWATLAANLECLPADARPYFEKLCAKVEEFDPHEDDELALTIHLEVPVIRAKPRKNLGAKSKHDYGQVFDWVDSYRRKSDVELEAALIAYIEEFDLEDGYETIKSAYHKVRSVRLANMDQVLPHISKPIIPRE